MTQKTVEITLLVTFVDMNEEERKICKELASYTDIKEIPTLEDYSVEELSDIFHSDNGEVFEDLLAGSNLFADIKCTKVKKSEFVLS